MKAMFKPNKTNWSLLAKDLAGETNTDEKQYVSEWLGQKPEHTILYQQLKSDWKIINTMKAQFNVDNAWSNLHNRIMTSDKAYLEPGLHVKEKQYNRPVYTAVLIAASILLVAMLGVSLLLMTNRMQKTTVYASANERGKIVNLPDGSVVNLNSNSYIQYSKHFNAKTREIKLTGEAFFEVKPDKNKPFTVYANQARIRVLGTSFNVDAKAEDQQVEVYVSAGIVELSESGEKDNMKLLEPGMIGLLHNSKITALQAENENSMAWKTGNISFNLLTLQEAIAILNEIYDVKIICRESGIDTVRFEKGERFHNESLDDILKVICIQNNLKVEKSDDLIYLSRQ
jgi:transmembrane sensor